ncbi:probable carboxylesterase 18 [Ipomoea triloba]|uniref:probable carboxylesterase 18 n=1 Tax=Ipomoea triloba TaxID=35885 RepID=UPI00125DDF9B|nr:probable carboxylesterase 18 [Ipomoea triloba]
MSSSDVQVEASKDVWFRLSVPNVDKHEEQQSLPLIVYFHGGRFTSLSPDLKACFLAGDNTDRNIAHHITVRALNFVTDCETLNLAGQLSLQPFFCGEERTELELRLRKATMLTLEGTDRMWRTFCRTDLT